MHDDVVQVARGQGVLFAPCLENECTTLKSMGYNWVREKLRRKVVPVLMQLRYLDRALTRTIQERDTEGYQRTLTAQKAVLDQFWDIYQTYEDWPATRTELRDVLQEQGMYYLLG